MRPSFRPAFWLYLLMFAVGSAASSAQDIVAEDRDTLILKRQDPIVTTEVDGTFIDMTASLRNAIIGKGIHISHILPAAGMLHRTGPAFGYKNDVYGQAESYEFCSAELSHRLARQHPDNIVMCPFTIAVYTVPDKPGKVYLSYRIPSGRPGSEVIVKDVINLLQGIVDDATW